MDSTALEWLVVVPASSKGQLRGSGTINGAGNYGVSRRRRVYDTTPGGAEDIDVSPTLPIAGGSVVIHRE